jgi:hypothetical protein
VITTVHIYYKSGNVISIWAKKFDVKWNGSGEITELEWELDEASPMKPVHFGMQNIESVWWKNDHLS